jgi:uncharacterized protein YbbK (DUF523 family)
MIIVSACLAGIPCRYDGERKTNKKIKELVKEKKQYLFARNNWVD